MKHMTRSKLRLFGAFVALLLGAAACDPSGKEKPQASVTVSVTPGALSFTAAGSEEQTLSVKADGRWTSSKSDNWVTLSPDSGNGDAEVKVKSARNTGKARSLTIAFTGSDSSSGKTVTVSQDAYEEASETPLSPEADAFDGTKRSSLTYQLLIYSFADSNGDGVGDFAGITSKLDYLDKLGVTALWLSPAHPAMSYHAYDVTDYGSLNPLYGSAGTKESAEADFKDLIAKAHGKGIKIYMDYVLNHSGKDNPWFQSAISNPDGPYGDYYVISENPDADVKAGKVPNFEGTTSAGMGTWYPVSSGSRGYKGRLRFHLDWTAAQKTVTVSPSSLSPQTSNPSARMWLWIGSVGAVGLYEVTPNVFEIILDVDTDWGFLVRTSTSTWDGGTKWGAPAGSGPLEMDKPFTLGNASPGDITFGGKTVYYFASFSESMPDLNYGLSASAADSPAFKAIAATADKWIGMGVDGFRLDAVRWIYQNSTGGQNPTFLDQWYRHCNDSWHAAGHADNLFMVAEAWMDGGHAQEKAYYKGLPSCFEFDYWGKLKDAVVSQKGSAYAPAVIRFIEDHKAVRSDAVTSLFMTNHDGNRAASDLGRSLPKEKQAAAMLLTSGGKPFVYQGEELGYWGTKDGGDEYVRTPIMWDKAGKDCARKGVNGKVDAAMLTASISVEAQDADAGSLLQVYRTFARLRNTYPALAEGTMTALTGAPDVMAAWYMTASSGQKMLVVHNVAGVSSSMVLNDDLSHPVALLGSGSVKEKTLTLAANSSVVFLL